MNYSLNKNRKVFFHYEDYHSFFFICCPAGLLPTNLTEQNVIMYAAIFRVICNQIRIPFMYLLIEAFCLFPKQNSNIVNIITFI